MARWIGGPHASHRDRLADGHVLRHCSGRPTLDLGCGPGRFTASLRERGWAALIAMVASVAITIWFVQRGGRNR
jgi:trans-aconitate methyltransferase